MDDDDATVNTASSRVFHADSLVARQTNTSRGSSSNEWDFFFFRISAPYLWAVSKTFRWDFTGEFISAVSLYLFLSPFFFFFFFFTFSFGQVYQRQTDKFVCRGTMLLRMNNNRFLRITCFAKCTRIILFVQTNGKSFPKSTDDRSFPLQIITRLYALENV